MERLKNRPIVCCAVIFLICAIARIAEYFIIRTDETVISENFIHKLFGILLLLCILKSCKWKWSDIGFVRKGMFKEIGAGLLLGSVCFAVAYAVEYMVMYVVNGDVHLEFYASGFSLTNDMQRQSGFVFILLCILFNIINVWMEEGIFRGLFAKILDGMSFLRSTLFIALLFGVWHWVMPLRDYIEGDSTLANLAVMGIGYIILAGIMSVKWSILDRITGSLWMGLGEHLFNNVIVTNLLHVISNGEADSMQIVRIMIGQLVSFGVVLIYYFKCRRESRNLNAIADT